MKKLIPIFILILTFCFTQNVHADTIIETVSSGYDGRPQIDWLKEVTFYCSGHVVCSLDDAYNEAISSFNSQNKPYYAFMLQIGQDNKTASFLIRFISDISTYRTVYHAEQHKLRLEFSEEDLKGISFIDAYSDPHPNHFYLLYDTNIPLINMDLPINFELRGFYSNNDIDNIKLNKDSIPLLKDLIKYSSWSDYNQSNLTGYTEVNLDNYHSILLTLKDYSHKKAFDVNLPVKGQVGITPVYDYGQSEKSNITDRCNINYKDFTDYRLYVLDSDLKNNALYYVKECSSGSSIKIDTSIFNITYVTDDNVNDPVVTVGGKDYHVIPFDQLSNTANKNEDNNFIPGESKPLSLSEIISNTTDTLSSVWGSITTFMSLVTKFFNTLPIEIRTLAITTFLTSCTLGIIKIIRA